jgi:hypothetical protein
MSEAFLAEEAPPPRTPPEAAVFVRMLPETVPGLPDELGHIQLENEARRIERPLLPRDRGNPPCRKVRSTCHSPLKHALPIGA